MTPLPRCRCLHLYRTHRGLATARSPRVLGGGRQNQPKRQEDDAAPRRRTACETASPYPEPHFCPQCRRE
ncbi:hypothetical protein C8Q77DRAFT_343165 [Trametes polyzona]|nr:hypothetical protein C8Q77DRAFT_343165 [Trametes polyzona]